MDLSGDERACQIAISPVLKELGFPVPDQITDEGTKFSMRQQRKRHRSARDDKRDRRHSRTTKGNPEEFLKTENDSLQNDGENNGLCSEICLDRITDAGRDDSSHVIREHRER